MRFSRIPRLSTHPHSRNFRAKSNCFNRGSQGGSRQLGILSRARRIASDRQLSSGPDCVPGELDFMRLRSERCAQRGNTLLVTLWTLFLIAFGLAIYLRLAVNNNQLAARSQVWNACMPVLEAGIEEALTHCYSNSTNMLSNGWSLSNGRCSRTNVIGEGYYDVNISLNEPFDVVATGYYPMPGSSKY